MKIVKYPNKFIYISLFIPIILTVALFVLSFFFFVIPSCRKIKMDSKQEMLSELSNSVVSMLNAYEMDVNHGLITREKAKEAAIAKIRSLRYGKDHKAYFWINDTLPKMIMHPFIPELEGKYLGNYHDINGKNIFNESINITAKTGDGYINYYWQQADDSLTTAPKLSFVKRFPSWGWIVGTGIYINDVNEEVYSIKSKLVIISLLIISVILILLSYLVFLTIRIENKKKIVENELKEAKENYKTLIDNAPDAILVYDVQQNKIADINLVGQKLFGGSASQLINTDPRVLFPANQSENGEMLEIFKKTIKGEQPVFISLVRNLEGKEFYCEVRLVKLPAENGRLIRASIIDITLRKQAEELSKKNEETLIALNADKDRFFSILAHDLRSPFNTIIGFADLLKSNFRDFDDSQIEKFLYQIDAEAKNTYNLLEDILLWAGSQSGKLYCNPEMINITEICNEVLSVMALSARTKNIQIQNKMTDTYYVLADKGMIKTVLRNLISNAIKFSYPNGCVVISCEFEYSKLIVKVSDNGIGISDDEFKKIFDVTKKFSKKGTLNECGTGLGLILCKEFVEKNKGEIRLENKTGTHFSFTLPIAFKC